MLAAGTSGLDAVATAQPGEVVLEQSPGFPSALNPPDDPAVRVAHYGRNTVVLDIAAPRAGLVVASENFFDGWTVLVNGQPAPLLAGNYAFRAVPVGPGLARVEFRYWPPGLTAGLALSGISFAVLALLPFIAAVRRRSVPGP
jgi:uncharacterized membrane protein YfhO